jgi:hypothetical protein
MDASVSSIALMSQEVVIHWRVEEEAAERVIADAIIPSLHGGTTAPYTLHDKNKTPSLIIYRWH